MIISYTFVCEGQQSSVISSALYFRLPSFCGHFPGMHKHQEYNKTLLQEICYFFCYGPLYSSWGECARVHVLGVFVIFAFTTECGTYMK